MKRYTKDLIVDIAIIVCTTIVALYVVQNFHFTPNIFYVFVAGIFFTSAFTIAPSSIVLARMAEVLPLHSVVIAGALGAMVGDYILFTFIRDRFAKDLTRFLKHFHIRFLLKSFHVGFLKWISPVVGALIIASPLPDEFGIMLMGISRVKTRFFLAITFVMNMLGILLVVGFSRLW